jgi:hypothetical protein
MAVFNKNTLTQISGFDNQIIAGELVYEQQTFWNLSFVDANSQAIDLTNATIDTQIIRRKLANVRDSRYGLTFDISDYTPMPTPIPLVITNRDNASGVFTLLINDDAWGLISNDPDLDINSINGAGFSGRIKISFPQSGNVPAYDLIVFLMFLVRSDAIINN